SILLKQKQYEDALRYFERALALKPDAANLHYDSGRALKSLNNLDAAKASFEQAFKYKPDNTDALLQIAQILRDEKKIDDALAYFKRVIAIKPDGHAEANIGQILHSKGLYNEAMIHYERARALMPESYHVLNNMGITYKALGNHEESIECYLQSLSLNPDVEETLSNLSGAYKNLGKLEEAIEYNRRAVSLATNKSWIHSNLLLAMIYASFISPDEVMKEAQKFGAKADGLLRTRKIIRDLNPERKLRIGYVTSDFTDHAVNYFFEPLLKTHDRNSFKIFAYANVEIEDAVTERLKQEFDHWCDIKLMDDDEAANLIEKDEIDILIDISGHTRGNRLMVFARKPAPIQVTWLAYPGTTGLKAMDYRITDSYAEPPGMTEHLNTENLWRLPEIFCCYQAHVSNPPVIDYPPFEDNGYITFGCFNNFAKITDPVLEAWGKIMKRVPNSRLLLEIAAIESLKIRSEIEERLHRFLPMDRVTLEPRIKSNQFILYNEIDIALDPFPCVGGTTSMDTLWMGVPFITLAGQNFTSRMGVSILSNAGLPELIAHNIDDYIDLAVKIATSPDKIRALRTGLREKVVASPLMNQKLFTKNMEMAYRQMWKKYCNSQGQYQ
ncbi:MAG: tetratricopeptide repeat protein, partial [Alphaproteobacteria bacterium]